MRNRRLSRQTFGIQDYDIFAINIPRDFFHKHCRKTSELIRESPSYDVFLQLGKDLNMQTEILALLISSVIFAI